MLRQRTFNFAAKRFVDMRYVSGLDRATAERHFRWRPAVPPGGFGFRAAPEGQAELAAARRRGDIAVAMDDADRRATVRWKLPAFRRHRRQSDRIGSRICDAARLREARRAPPAERHLARRVAAAAGLGRLCADRDAYRTSYAACFRTNIDRQFPDLPADTAWASGASDQRIFILRRHRLTVVVSNETDHPMDLPALNRVIATAIAAWA
jgi:hypothetical protein